MAKAPTKSTQQKTPSSPQEQEPLVKTHFVPPAKINTEYRSKITTKLIHSIEELKQALKSNSVVAWDTETTGLNPERSEIVGFSFSYDGKEAYYCPVKHVDIALGKESLSLFIESLKTSPCSLLYNARFDIRVMEYSGFDMSFMYPKDPSTGQSSPRFIDVMNSVWLSDTNFPLPSLKASTLHFLGYQPPKFLETLGEAESFQYLTAEKAYDYAALDAANTYNLALVTMRYHKEAGLAANLDTATIYIIGQLEKTPINMDTQYLKDLRDRTYQDVLDLEKRIYSYAGSSFKIGSNRELTKVFESLGIDTGERTKAHDMKTGIDLLQAYLRDHPDTPIITDLIQYKEKFKFYNSYLKTLVDIAENQEEYPPRFNYKLQAVPTSRLACGKDGKNTYFAPLNLQCLKHDTRVLTPNGLKPISEIKDGDLVWDGQDFSVCNQLGSREKEIIKVECGHNHYLEASREHQVYAYHNSKIGWFSLGELEEGDFLAVNRKSPEKEDTIIPISLGQIPRPKGGLPRKEIHVDRPMMDFWFLCGYFVGDGYFIKDKDHFRGVGILVPDNKIDAKSKLLSGFLEVGITPFEKFSKKENYKDILVLVTKSVAFTELLLSLGFKHKAENKVIPDIIFSLSPRQKLSFIDGLLSSDGHVGKSIEYKTVSIDLAESFRNLLETLGYFSTFRGSRKTGYYLLVHDKNRFKKESGITVKYKNDSIVGTRRRNGLPRDFYKSLPSSITNKVSNDPDLLYQNGVEEAKFYYKKITSIQPMGIETTYDLYVPNTNRFTANGFIVHNSIPKPQSNKSFGRPATQEEIDRHEDLLGWVFSPDHPEWSPGKCVEGMCPDDNVRRAFLPEHPENGDYVVSVDMCLESGSPVQTKRGYLGISELKVGDDVFSPKGWVKVIRVSQTGVKKLVKVYPDNGGQAIYCSEDHPFILNGEKVEAKDINGKLPCIELYDYRSSNLFVGESTPTSAYLFGFILCSGNILRISEDTKRLVVWSEDESHLRLIGKIFGGDYEIRHKVTDQSEWWVLHLSQNDVCDRLISLGKPCGLTMSSNGIDFAWLGSNFRHFIRGMFDAVGSFSTEEEFSPELAGDVSYMSQVLNYLDGHWGYKKKSRVYFNLQGSVSDKRFIYKYLYEGATIWLQRKRDRIDEWYKDNVGDIEMPVWDITVDSEDHLYYVNGVLTHNCAEELRVVTNLFSEQSWARVINAGGDLHHANSDAIFGAENYTKETRKMAKCISGKSLIFTTRGIKKLEDLCKERIIGEPQLIDYMIATPEGLSKATHFIYNGKRETRIIHFNDGTTLEATPDHIVQSKKVLRKVGDLCVGDVVDIGSELVEVEDYQSISLPFITGCKLPITEDIAYLLGAILGDGSLDRKTVKYLSIDPELIEEIKRIVHYLNLSDSEPYYEDMYRKKQPRKIPVTYLNCGSKRFLILLECLGINKNNHKDLIVPEIIFRSPSSVRGRFLRGLFDTDGWVADSELSIGFCSKSLSFTQDIHYLLLSLGILNTVQFSFNKVYHRDYYKIRIAQVSSRQFLEVVGFYNNKKRERLLKHLDWYKPTKARIPKKEIVKIEESISEVFDLTVDNKSHLFYANGFIVHNCAAFGILYGQEYRGFQQHFPSMTLDEAKDFMIKFKKTIPSIIQGQQRMIRDAKRTGIIYSYFGHPRRVKQYFSSPNFRDVAFGERTVKNNPIQSTSADVLKIELIRLWDNLFTKYPQVKFICTIHDEVNYSVPRSLASEVIPIILKCMTVKMPNWIVPLDCSLSVGSTLGGLIPFKYDFATKTFTPEWEEYKAKTVVVEEPKEASETLSTKDDIEEIDSLMFDLN